MKFDLQQGHLDIHIDFERVSFLIIMTMIRESVVNLKLTIFLLLFEALALQLVKLLPVHQVSGLLGTYDQKLWNIMDVYTEECRES